MNGKLPLIIGIVLIFIGLGSAGFFLLNDRGILPGEVRTEQGESLAAHTYTKRSYSNDQFSDVIQKSIPASLSKGSTNFGINTVNNPEDGWYVVTCTFDIAEDGPVKFVINEDNEKGTLVVIYNPLTMPDTERSLLPKTVQDLLGGKK